MCRKDRALALVVSFALNGLFAAWLVANVPVRVQPLPTPADAMEIVWITDRRAIDPPPQEPAHAPAAAPAARAREDRVRPARSAPVAVSAAEAPSASEPVVVAGNDTWSPVDTAHGRPPGSAVPTFRRNPLQRPEPDGVAIAPRVRLVMRLEAGFEARCRELKTMMAGSDARLTERGTTREVVALSMQKDRCFR